MPQGKHKASVAARSRLRPPGRAAKSAVDNRKRTAWGRPHAGGRAGERPTEQQDATRPQSYLQWAAFAAGTQDGDFGFGAYFADASSAPSAKRTWTEGTCTKSTWTPARRG
jgi:hypothetical protein